MKVANLLASLSKSAASSESGLFAKAQHPNIAFSLVTFNRQDLIDYIRHYKAISRPSYCQSTSFRVHTLADPYLIQEHEVDLKKMPVGTLRSTTATTEEVAYLIPTFKREIHSPHAIMLSNNPTKYPDFCTFNFHLPINMANTPK